VPSTGSLNFHLFIKILRLLLRQLNDIWQAPTWASVEYTGRWKLLQYFARNFFAPVLISSFEINDNFEVHVTSDLRKVYRHILFIIANCAIKSISAKANMVLWSWKGNILTSWNVTFQLDALQRYVGNKNTFIENVLARRYTKMRYPR
jgi:beta-galactosidase/beta-glucuronidase